MKFIRIIASSSLCLLAACSNHPTTQQANKADTVLVKDEHTLSNADSVYMKHLSLDLNVDLAAQQLRGYATWDIENKQKAQYLCLDDNQLHIDSVWVDDHQ